MPRAGASYALRVAQGALGDTRLRASYGQGIVEPRFDQSFGTDPCFPGDPNLLPEESRTVNAGIEQKLASGSAVCESGLLRQPVSITSSVFSPSRLRPHV